ncbi:MAG: IS21 family transposase, partial [Nitrospira sp.]|nr:IS21 family transposase [Nitrospira sp.]
LEKNNNMGVERMLKMGQYELIKTAFRVYGHSIRGIVRDYGHSRNTVRKAIRGVSPGYERKKPMVNPVMDAYREEILLWLKSDLTAPKKQRHTAHRVYTRLVEEYGFSGAESTVRRYVRLLKIEAGLYKQEAFIPLEVEPGKEAEVDWGRAVVMMSGEKYPVELFCMRPKYSGKDFVRAYPHSRQEAFFDGHIHAFDYYGGVFPRLIYDNLSSAVLKVLRGKKRLEQKAFIAFRSYYTFQANFCNPGKGNEKGGVEGLVGYARRNYLVPVPEVESFDELNELLLKRCLAHSHARISGKEGTIEERFEMERSSLLSLPTGEYPVKQLFSAEVDHYSTIKVDSNRYSVPTYYAGLKVDVELGVDRLSIYYNHRKIAEHRRAFGKGKWQLDPFHYLELLIRKPGAFEAARPIRQWRAFWPASYERLLDHFRHKNTHGKGTKEFIKVLMLLADHPKERVDQAILEALQLGLSDAASLQVLLDVHKQGIPEGLEPLSIEQYPRLTGYEVAPPDLESYGALLKGGC